MGDAEYKKRKRAEVDEDALLLRPRKSQVVERKDTNPSAPLNITKPSTRTDGRSRQEKSERRSKRRQETRTNVSTEAEENGELKIGALANSDRHLVTEGRRAQRDSQNRQRSGQPPRSVSSDNPAPIQSVTIHSSTKQQRFILFVGNLPYTATTPQIQSHFAKLAPKAVRHSTNKSTGRSKGFAFLEFDGYDKMKTCLKLYHHSIFDPQELNDPSVESAVRMNNSGRKINVELTAGGGGGRSEKRKEKIKEKNHKLDEQRERRKTKEKEEKQKDSKGRAGNPATSANAMISGQKDEMGDIHPSRRNRVG